MDHSTRVKHYHKSEDNELLILIKGVINQKPTYGYRRITVLVNAQLRRQGFARVNHKRIYRIMSRNGLLLQNRPIRPKRMHAGKVEILKRNIRWWSDRFSIQCLNGEQVHVAFSIDACDREIMRYIASTKGIDGEAIRDLMFETVEYRFNEPRLPYCIQWLSDNGS